MLFLFGKYGWNPFKNMYLNIIPCWRVTDGGRTCTWANGTLQYRANPPSLFTPMGILPRQKWYFPVKQNEHFIHPL